MQNCSNNRNEYNLMQTIMNLEEYYSIENFEDYLSVQPCLYNKNFEGLFNLNNNLNNIQKLIRINFCIDIKPKEFFFEKKILSKVFSFYKIYSESNNKFINILAFRKKYDTNEILKKINEKKIFKGPLKIKLNINEFPIKTYFLEEKEYKNIDNNTEGIEKEFILKKINSNHNLNDRKIFINTFLKLEEYYSIEYNDLFFSSNKNITNSTIRVNFLVDGKAKEVLIEKNIIDKIYSICKIYSENNKFIKVLVNRDENYDTNEILKKINENKIFRGAFRLHLKIEEFPIITYYLEEKLIKNKVSNIDDNEKEFILKKIKNNKNNINKNININNRALINNNIQDNNYNMNQIIFNQNFNNNNINNNFNQNNNVNLMGNNNIILLSSIQKNDIENKLKEFRLSIDKFKEDINGIERIFQNVIDYCENLYYKFSKEIINNLKEIYNEELSTKLDNIVNSKNYTKKIIKIFKMYNSINNHQLNFDEQSDKLTNENYGKEKELMEELSKKNSEIKRLNSLMPLKLNPGETLMTVIFNSDDENVHYSFICKNTDMFEKLESKLYEIYPEYSKTDNSFFCNGRIITKSKDLDYNKIKNSDIITLYSGIE